MTLFNSIIELSTDSCNLLDHGVVTLATVGIVCLLLGSLQVFVCASGLSGVIIHV